MLIPTSPSSCFLTCFATDIYLGRQRKKNDPSQAAVNKITAHSGLYTALIHHLLPASSCYSLMAWLLSGRDKKQKAVMEF